MDRGLDISDSSAAEHYAASSRGSIGQPAWLVPHAPAFAEGVARVAQLVARGGGTRMSGLYMEAREAEWLEGCYRA